MLLEASLRAIRVVCIVLVVVRNLVYIDSEVNVVESTYLQHRAPVENLIRHWLLSNLVEFSRSSSKWVSDK
jgi:hypothetical protein